MIYLSIAMVLAFLSIFLIILRNHDKEVENKLQIEMKDETLYDPETEGSMTYEQAVSGMAFINPDENDGEGRVKTIEIDTDELIAFVQKQLDQKISLDDLTLFFDIQNEYLAREDDTEIIDNVDYLVKKLKVYNAFNEQIIKKILKLETDYINRVDN